MASLEFRLGDPQSLKAIIASTAPLNLVPVAENDRPESPLVLRLPSGVKITDSNAMTEALSELFPFHFSL